MNIEDYTVKTTKIGEISYPKNLVKIMSPPRELYFRGRLSKALLAKSIAIVGSRRMTRYGCEAVDRFVSAFVVGGVTTISGFMYGVDTEVHERTLEYGGKTAAVFGCGLDVVYPPDNRELYLRILTGGGAVISEYEQSARPHIWKFPQRNRIVAGLATLGVLVIEAGEASGSIVTAMLARKMGKPVYAVPGPITGTMSVGTNKLIKEGCAEMVTCPEDIIKIKTALHAKPTMDDQEEGIYELLLREELSMDEIARSLGKGVSELSITLTSMSLKGIVSESGGKFSAVER